MFLIVILLIIIIYVFIQPALLTTWRRIPTQHYRAALPVCQRVRLARSPAYRRTPRPPPNKRRHCKKRGSSSIVNSKLVSSVLDYEFFKIRDPGSVSVLKHENNFKKQHLGVNHTTINIIYILILINAKYWLQKLY